MQLTYSNSLSEEPIECTFEFPIELSHVIKSLIAQIDEKIIVAQIKSKEEAKDKYDDAMASGKTAVYAEKSQKNKEEVITLKIGNLLPG